jgi:hypothetical protein
MFPSFRVSLDFFVTLKSLQFYPITTPARSLSYTLSSSQRKQEHKTTNETPDDEKKKSRARTNLYFIIVPSTHEQRLVGVKIHPTHRSVVFVESVDQRSHAVVPQLHDTAV